MIEKQLCATGQIKISRLTTEELIKQLHALNVFDGNFDAHVKINGFLGSKSGFVFLACTCDVHKKKSYSRRMSLLTIVKCHATK